MGKQRERGTKGAARVSVWPCPVPGGYSMSYLLSKLSLAVSLLRVSSLMCTGGRSTRDGRDTLGQSTQCAGMAASRESRVWVDVLDSNQRARPCGNQDKRLRSQEDRVQTLYI